MVTVDAKSISHMWQI